VTGTEQEVARVEVECPVCGTAGLDEQRQMTAEEDCHFCKGVGFTTHFATSRPLEYLRDAANPVELARRLNNLSLWLAVHADRRLRSRASRDFMLSYSEAGKADGLHLAAQALREMIERILNRSGAVVVTDQVPGRTLRRDGPHTAVMEVATSKQSA
jgi:hypothetical protein